MNKFQESIKSLRDPAALLILLFGVLATYAAWIIIAVYQAGITFTELLWGQAYAAISVVLLMMTSFIKPINKFAWIEKLLLLLPAISILVMVLTTSNTTMMYLTFIIAISAIRILSTCNYAVNLPLIQNGHNKDMKLAIILSLLPVIQAISYVILGFIAEIHINLALAFIATTLSIFVFIIFMKKKRLNIIPPPVKMASKTPLSTKIIIACNVIYVAPYYVTANIIVPLYLYDKLDGDFAKIGIILSILCFVAIFSKLVQKEAKREHAPTSVITLVSTVATSFVFIVWVLTDSIIMATIVLSLYTLSHRMFSFGILSEIEKSDPANYSQHTKIKEIYQHCAAAISFSACAFFASNVQEGYDKMLISFSVITISIAFLFAYAKRVQHTENQLQLAMQNKG